MRGRARGGRTRAPGRERAAADASRGTSVLWKTGILAGRVYLWPRPIIILMGSLGPSGLVSLLLVTGLGAVVAALGAQAAADEPLHDAIDCSFRAPEQIAELENCIEATFPDELDVAAAADGTVHAVYLAEGDQVLYSRRVSGETAFRAPVRLSSGSTARLSPQVEVAPNGTVHVLWLEHVQGSMPLLRWAVSGDRGGNWTWRTMEVHGGVLGMPIAISLDGIPAMLIRREINVLGDGRGYPRYYLSFCSWDTDGGVLVDAGVAFSEELGSPRLVFGQDGTVHCTYRDNATLVWMRSSDGGRSWHLGCYLDVGDWLSGDYGVAAMTGGRLALAWTGPFSPTGPGGAASHVAGRQLSWMLLSANTTGGYYNRPVNITTHYSHPHAYGLVSRGDEVCLFFLGFHRIWSGDAVTEGPVTLDLMYSRINTTWGHDYPWYANYGHYSSYVFDRGGRLEEEYNWTRLAACLEQGPRPVVVTSLFKGEGAFRLHAWRVNHPPSMPAPVSESAGGWVLCTTAVLEVTEVFDADGDALRYMFECHSIDDEPMVPSEWMAVPKRSADGLHHGAYFWSATVQDSTMELASGGGWWFRVDTGPPTANAGLPCNVSEGDVLPLYGGRSRDDGPLVVWEWDWDGDGVYDTRRDEPTLDVVVDVEGRWNVSLRVTDEVGRTDTDTTMVEVHHTEPGVVIDGPATVDAGGGACPYAVVVEPAFRHIYTCAWYVDGVGPAVGATMLLSFHELGPHDLAVRVTDELGRPLNAQLTVMARWAGPAEVGIAAPATVYAGETYRVRALPLYLNESAEWTFSWYRDGEPVGEGRSLDLVAQREPSETIGLLYSGSDGYDASAEAVIVVREHLTPPRLTLVGNTTTSSLRVSWTASEQPAMFQRYIVRVSDIPFSRADLPDLGWTYYPGGISPFESADLNNTTRTFDALLPGTYYHIAVYVEGGGEVAMSNVVVAVTQPVPTATDPDGDSWWSIVRPVDLAVFVVAVAVVAVMASVRLRKGRRQGGTGPA